MEDSDEESDHVPISLFSEQNFSQSFLDFLADDERIFYNPDVYAPDDPLFLDRTRPRSFSRNDIVNCSLPLSVYAPSAAPRDDYDSHFRDCQNSENVICVKMDIPANSKGASMNSILVDVLANRSTKTLVIRALHSMTDQWKEHQNAPRFSEALKIEQSLISSNTATHLLLRDSVSRRAINDSFKAYTGLHHMVKGLKSMCIHGNEVEESVRSVQKLIRPKIVQYINQKGAQIHLPNMEHYGERGFPFSAHEVLALAFYLKKDICEFIQDKGLDRFQFRDKPSEFIIPRYLFLNSSIEEKYYRFRFGTDDNPDVEKTAVIHGIYTKF